MSGVYSAAREQQENGLMTLQKPYVSANSFHIYDLDSMSYKKMI